MSYFEIEKMKELYTRIPMQALGLDQPTKIDPTQTYHWMGLISQIIDLGFWFGFLRCSMACCHPLL